MAYTFYHPTGDESNEVQLYIFEMGDPLKALGKYGAEKPDEAKPVAVGTEGYTAAGQHALLRGPVLHADRLDPGRPQVRGLRPGDGRSGSPSRSQAALAAAVARRRRAAAEAETEHRGRRRLRRPQPANARGSFRPLPGRSARAAPKYVAQDVFGYSFLSDVFMADYKEGDVTWQGFLRPYADADGGQGGLREVPRGAKQDGAEIKRSRPKGPTG